MCLLTYIFKENEHLKTCNENAKNLIKQIDLSLNLSQFVFLENPNKNSVFANSCRKVAFLWLVSQKKLFKNTKKAVYKDSFDVVNELN